MSVFIPTQPPTSVPTADDLATPSARTGNGFVVATTGRITPGDNGAAAYIYHRTGRSGQVLDGGAFVAGPGIDDYWEVTRKDSLNFSIYPADKTGVVDDGYLPLTNDVTGETLVVNEGVYLIASDYTLNRRVQFENGARFKVANGFTLHLSAGYVAEPNQWVFDIDDGGEVTLDQMSGVSVAHFGAVPDVVASGGYTGTNQSVRLQAAFDANESIASAASSYSDPYRPEILIPPGSYRLDTGVTVKNKSNLYGAGATLFYFGSQASAGAILTIGEFAGVGLEIELGTFFLPSVTGLPVANFTVPVANEEFAAVRIAGAGSSVFHCELTNYCSIGLELRPHEKSYVAHNHFLNHKAWAVKTAIDFHWRWDTVDEGNFGWTNENVFTNCNWTQDSATSRLGTCIGNRFRCTTIRPTLLYDFGGCNNNRFFGCCYQPAGEFAGTRLTVGMTVVQNYRYFNHETRQEYICDVAGVVATIPTNTNLGQSSADANGVRFTHRGHYVHAPVVIDKAGGFNIWHGCRWEYGDGAFCYLANSIMQVANVNRGNEIVLYDYSRQNADREGKVLIDDYTMARRNELAGFRNTARLYGQDLNHKVVIEDIHKRFIASAEALTFRGMQVYDPQQKKVVDYASYGLDTWTLLKNAVGEYTTEYLGLVVDLSESRRISSHATVSPTQNSFTVDVSTNEIICNGHGLALFEPVRFEGDDLPYPLKKTATYFVVNPIPSADRFKVSEQAYGAAIDITDGGSGAMTFFATWIRGSNLVIPLDRDGNFVDVPTSTQNDCVSNGNWNSGPHIWQIGGEPLYFGLGANRNITKAFIGYSGAPSLATHMELSAVPGGTVNSGLISVVTPDKGRFSVGVPIGGFFPDYNEFIRNYTAEAFSLSGWRVRQTGVLAKDWAVGVDVKSTELRTSDGKIYAAINSGTTGATAPTGNTPVTFDANATTNEIEKTAHGLTNGKKVKFTGAYLPGNIIQNTIYFVVGATANTFQVSRSSGGAAIDFSSAGHSATYTAIVSDDTVEWEYFSPVAELEEIYEGEALAAGLPAVTGNLTLNSDGSSSNWYKANTYISQKVLSGDFDITFEVMAGDTPDGQSHMVGVTSLTSATEFNNYQNFQYGVLWYGPTEVEISRLAAQKVYNIAGWGNNLVRLVRTGTTIDMYINDVLIALETATFTANAGTDVITSAAHGLADNRPVRFEGVDLPAGIVEGTVYYVRDSATNTFKIKRQPVTSVFSVDVATNVITSAAHGLSDDWAVIFSGADLPDGIVAGTTYYVRDKTIDTFKIAATVGGAAIDILDFGTGSITWEWGAIDLTDVGSGTMTFFANAIVDTDLHPMYSAYDLVNSHAIIYKDEYKPTYQGAALIADLLPIQDVDAFEEIDSSATPVFRWTIFPGRTKLMELTANVTSMTFLIDEPGHYRIIFTQDATGGRTVVFPAGIKGTQPTLNLLGGESTVFEFIDTGTERYWGNVVTDERVNVTITGNASGVSWDSSRTYISNDTLTGDFDITFEVVDRNQSHMVGVTANTLPAAGANYNILKYGVYWLSNTSVEVWEDTVNTTHAIATWGNGLARMVRTGSNMDLYINGTLVAAANNPAFTTAPLRRMYSAYLEAASEAVIYNDLSVPISSGANLTRVNTALPDENGVETVSFSATASFNFAVDPRKNKTMTLTANATGLIVIAPTPGVYYISLTQDGTGGRTVAWATTINGTAPTMAAGAGTSTLFPIYSNGTDLFWM